MLKQLVEFYEEIKDRVCPHRHVERELSWIVELTENGEFLGLIPSDREIPVPDCYVSGRGNTPRLLVDKPDYALGLDIGDKGEEKIRSRHESFLELLRECEGATGSEEIRPILAMLEDESQTSRIIAPEDMGGSDLITFSVGGRIPVLRSEMQDFWIRRMREKANRDSDLNGECMVCGEHKPIARVNREKVLGAKLISANKSAFRTHGLEQSEIAPVCIDCSEIYPRALNYLIGSDEHSVWVYPTVNVFWTSGPLDFNTACISDPGSSGENVGSIIEAAFKSKGAPVGGDGEFYALSLVPNQSRLTVRSWIQTTIEEAKDNLSRYFSMQRMVGPNGEDDFYSLTGLARSLSLGGELKKIPEGAKEALLDCALEGTPLPDRILYQAMIRVKAGEKNKQTGIRIHMTRPRAALMRLVFQSQRPQDTTEENEVTAELNEQNDSPPYLCGRLLAVLESIQKSAVPGIKATLIDRYFGTASSAPATVFGSLLRSAQNHLSKLRRDESKGGAYYALSRRLEEICDRIPEFPDTLPLRDQALFSLGYYQQKASDRRSAIAHAEAKENEEESEQAPEPTDGGSRT